MIRRNFVKWSMIGTGGFIATGCHSKADAQSKQTPTSINKPIVVSTWISGVEANKAAWKILDQGGSALDAVEAGVRVTESDIENRSVGIGGNPDSAGRVTLDACIMNHKSECGAVACLQNIEHPISVARKVMEETPHVLLVGSGAEEFAVAQGFERKNLLTSDTKKAWEEWKKQEVLKKPAINHENHDTIGMLALDSHGNLSGSCTTSGWAYKMPGRVGDSPIIGAGLFVDNEVGAACATGMGEAILRIAGSSTVVELMRHGYTPTEACKEAVMRILRKHDDHTGLQVGFLALNKNGVAGGYSSYAGFNYALTDNQNDELIDAKYEMEW